MAPAIEPLESQVRAGGRVLQLLSDALNVSILRQLARGPLPTPELPSRLSPASRTTRFSRLRELEDLGVISREKRRGTPPTTHCMLSSAGVELLWVAKRFAAWLSRAPGTADDRSRVADVLAIKALALGWSTGVLRWLAERPHSVTELAAQGAPQVSYHDVRRARQALAGARLIEPVPSVDRGRPFAPTRWGREAVGPLAAAIRWERESVIGRAGPLMPDDGETLLLLATPLIEVATAMSTGSCALLFETGGGVSVVLENGHLILCTPCEGVNGHCEIRGSASAWLDTLLDGRVDELEMRGAVRLTTELTNGLYSACS